MPRPSTRLAMTGEEQLQARMQEDLAEYLQPAHFVDSDNPAVIAFARRVAGSAHADADIAVRLFYAIRDGIRYDPYTVSLDPANYRASAVVKQSRAFCVPKAILLAACARALGVPARLGFADVRNHLSSGKLSSRLKTDLFVFHAYSELYIGGKWVKATPAFNIELCRRFGVRPLEFDGRTDALFHPYDAEGRRHMEYVRDRGTYADLPFETMLSAFGEAYGTELPASEEHDEAFHGGGPSEPTK
ncbi:MAG: transglutaminase family protein [Acidobacteriota bacterium]